MLSCLSRGSADNKPSILIISCFLSLFPSVLLPLMRNYLSQRFAKLLSQSTTEHTDLTIISQIHHYNCNTIMKTGNTKSAVWLPKRPCLNREAAAISTKVHILYSKIFMYIHQITKHNILLNEVMIHLLLQKKKYIKHYVWYLNLDDNIFFFAILFYSRMAQQIVLVSHSSRVTIYLHLHLFI